MQQIGKNIVLLHSSIIKEESPWHIVNDGVMGGLSTSKVIVKKNNCILFSGNISLENNGGFASLRSPVRNYDFENFTGIEVKIKGDGKIYQISMKETSYFTGSFFTASFTTKKSKWLVVKIPFSEFALHYFGRKVKSDSKIPLKEIKEIAILMGGKQEGAFELEIDSVKIY